jgi:hypothetical protein
LHNEDDILLGSSITDLVRRDVCGRAHLRNPPDYRFAVNRDVALRWSIPASSSHPQ